MNEPPGWVPPVSGWRYRHASLIKSEFPPAGSSFSRSVQPPTPTFAKLKGMDDCELMAQIQGGCNDALAVLFDRYHRLVLSIALKNVRDPGEAEDVMQNVFLEIFQSVAQFDPAKGTTKVWILQYAYHRAINRRQHLTARKFYDQANLDVVETHLPETASTPGGFTQDELKHLLRQGLATLNGPQKQGVELASYNGLSMREDRRQNGQLSIEYTAPLLPGTGETAVFRGTHTGEGASEGKDSGQQ
jgi:RNA polymerase sigma-70 factor (ECF subfamily)